MLLKLPSVKSRLLSGEVDECGRAIWRNATTTLANHTLLNQLYPSKYTPELITTSLIDSLGMPSEIALALARAAITLQEGFTVECKTVFHEEGRVGGPRHYEDFSIR